jgi:hypothetical protein
MNFAAGGEEKPINLKKMQQPETDNPCFMK